MTDLDEIERLLAKATPGEWRFGRGKSGLSVAAIAGEKKEVASSSWHHCSDHYPTERETVANFEALVALRNAAPAMIAELKALRRALEYLNSFGCPKCGGDCSSANPPVMMCPMLEAKAALHPSRRATAMNELIASTADEYGVQNNGTD